MIERHIQWAYWAARREHALLLRCEGLSYREIGARFGVHAWTASILVKRGARDLQKAMRKTHFRIEGES